MGQPERSGAPRSLRPSAPPGVSWSELLEATDVATEAATDVSAHGVVDLRLTGITADSRLVHPGDLYVAAAGATVHGADFAAEALRRGAYAVLTDPAGADRVRAAIAAAPAVATVDSTPAADRLLAAKTGTARNRVPVAVVAAPRALVPALADRIYAHPSGRLRLFGITGTNGKTTTAYLLQSALRAAGQRVGLIGTIGYQLDDEPYDSPRTTVTTPEAAELYALLARMAEDGATSVVLEVSSHALTLGRVDGLVFDVAAFTNFGSDHLDFHGDVASYFAAKASLFTRRRAERAVINLDDVRGRELVDQARSERVLAVRSVSLDGPADYTARERRPLGRGRTAVRAGTPDGPVSVTLAMPGEFNVRNALTALAMADLAGVDLSSAVAGLAGAVVPGRMQRVELGAGAPTVFVDFAHTPQAVSAVLASLAGHRRIVVLGCGGDRDPAKRTPMGAAAAAAAELVVVTDDNPRSEDPAVIRAQVLAGAHAEAARSRPDLTVLDGGSRREAIATALRLAGRDDVVAVLGKGHERGQEIDGRILPFSDVDVVQQLWAELRAALPPPMAELSGPVVAKATPGPDSSAAERGGR